MAASLAAFYQKVKIIHVEAGLRTGNMYHPYPEEINRIIIDAMTSIFCVHSLNAKENLLKAGIDQDKNCYHR